MLLTINYKFVDLPVIFKILNLQIFQRSQEIYYQTTLKKFSTHANIKLIFSLPIYGGGERIRTADLPRAKRTLCQLSYTPQT